MGEKEGTFGTVFSSKTTFSSFFIFIHYLFFFLSFFQLSAQLEKLIAEDSWVRALGIQEYQRRKKSIIDKELELEIEVRFLFFLLFPLISLLFLSLL
jgi:hypothetical protein